MTIRTPIQNQRLALGVLLLVFSCFAVSPDVFLRDIDDRNMVLIAVMMGIQLFVFLLVRVSRPDAYLLIFLAIVFLSALFQEDTRWSSSFYLALFCLSFMIYTRLLRLSGLSASQYIKLTRWLIFAYFIGICVQQLAVLIELPIPLAGNYVSSEPWKLSSIAGEPSHASINVAVLGYSFIELRKWYGPSKNDYLVLGCVFWVLITSQSSTGLVLFLFLLTALLSYSQLLFAALGLLVAVLALPIEQNEALGRVFRFVAALTTLDPSALISADHSGSYRLLPAYFLASSFDPFSIEGLFGYGNDYVAGYLYTVMPGTPEGHVAGGIAVTLTQNGLLAFLAFVVFVFTAACRKRNLYDCGLLLLILLFANGINNQVVWFSIIAVSTNKFFIASRPNPQESRFSNAEIERNLIVEKLRPE